MRKPGARGRKTPRRRGNRGSLAGGAGLVLNCVKDAGGYTYEKLSSKACDGTLLDAA